MKKLNTYRTFLLESKGIADICEKYQEHISKNILSILKSKIEIKKNIFFDFSSEKEFPLILNLELNLYPYKENVCNAKTILKNSILTDDIIKNTIIELEIYFNIMDNDFVDHIDSVILHELLHCYQFYNIKINKKSKPSFFSIGSMLPQIRNKYDDERIEEIINLLYISLRHEISAQLHHYFFFKKRGKDYPKIYNIINKLKNYKIPNIDDILSVKLNSLRKIIYNSIKQDKSKNYIKNLNYSIWNQENVNYFLSDLKELFDSSAKYIEKKISLVDKKLSQNEDFSSWNTIPTTFDREDFSDIDNYDPYFMNTIEKFFESEDYKKIPHGEELEDYFLRAIEILGYKFSIKSIGLSLDGKNNVISTGINLEKSINVKNENISTPTESPSYIKEKNKLINELNSIGKLLRSIYALEMTYRINSYGLPGPQKNGPIKNTICILAEINIDGN